MPAPTIITRSEGSAFRLVIIEDISVYVLYVSQRVKRNMFRFRKIKPGKKFTNILSQLIVSCCLELRLK